MWNLHCFSSALNEIIAYTDTELLFIIISLKIPGCVSHAGVSKSTIAAVMSAIGVTEAPFRIANGFFADKKVMTAYNQYTAAMFIAGAAVFCGAVMPGLSGELCYDKLSGIISRKWRSTMCTRFAKIYYTFLVCM